MYFPIPSSYLILQLIADTGYYLPPGRPTELVQVYDGLSPQVYESSNPSQIIS